jgi:mono/diheme cytochrome c family protein
MKRFWFAVGLVLVGLALVVPARVRGAAAVPSTHDEPHMEMSIRLPAQSGDRERAAAIVDAARRVMAQYPTVDAAERAGFKKFAPGVNLPMEHYTSGAYAVESWFGRFDLEHPTSLLFKRTPDGLKITGVMYTASNQIDEAQLNARIPLSVGTWHRHINYCAAPRGTPVADQMPPNARFGFAGSISTASDCAAAGGRFQPVIFGWMLHVWPNETDPAKVWAVDMDGDMHHHGASNVGMVGNRIAYNGLPIPLAKLPAQAIDVGDALRGASVFAQNCQSCHGIGGRNGPDAPALAGAGIAPGQVAYMVRHPQGVDSTSQMPLIPIDDRDLADVAAFVAGLR